MMKYTVKRTPMSSNKKSQLNLIRKTKIVCVSSISRSFSHEFYLKSREATKKHLSLKLSSDVLFCPRPNKSHAMWSNSRQYVLLVCYRLSSRKLYTWNIFPFSKSHYKPNKPQKKNSFFGLVPTIIPGNWNSRKIFITKCKWITNISWNEPNIFSTRWLCV